VTQTPDTQEHESPHTRVDITTKGDRKPWLEIVTKKRGIRWHDWLRPDISATLALFYLGTAGNAVRRALRWMLSARHSGRRTDRFVPIESRRWISDLAWSYQLLRSIEKAKTNMRECAQPPLHWKGAVLMKDPFDLAIYQMLVQELKPQTIIEVGAYHGGTAVWFADLLDLLKIDGHIYSFDINTDQIIAQHPRVTFLHADSNDISTFDHSLLASLPHPWLVVEDAHVNIREVLHMFDRYTEPGDYLAVEDTFAPTYYIPFRKFAADTSERYRVDTRFTDLFGYNMCWNHNGYLKRIERTE
jgi:cephalosporin hydroxylase